MRHGMKEAKKRLPKLKERDWLRTACIEPMMVSVVEVVRSRRESSGVVEVVGGSLPN